MNFTDILTEHSIPFREGGSHEHVRHGWIGLDCPWCSKGSNYFRLGYNLAGGFCSCWVCGYKSAPEVLAELLGIPFPQARTLLDGLETEKGKYVRPAGKLAIPPGVGPLLRIHRDYLKNRGFDPDEIAQLWGVQGIGLASWLAWRLFVPIHLNGQVVSWTTRSVMDCNERRYINARLTEEDVSPKVMLYGQDHARHAVIVCEGCTDAWKIGLGAVATMGVGFTVAQVEAMSKYPLRVICFDSEPAAQRRAYSLVQQLSCFTGETVQVTLDSKDAGSASEKELKQLRRFLR